MGCLTNAHTIKRQATPTFQRLPVFRLIAKMEVNFAKQAHAEEWDME